MMRSNRIRNRRTRIEVVNWPGVRFQRHVTARSVVAAFLGGTMDKPLQVIGGWGNTTGEDMLKKARAMGTWGFCQHAGDGSRVAVVHWWARRGASTGALFALLFHECLHAVLTAKGMIAHRQMMRFEAVARQAFRAVHRARSET